MITLKLKQFSYTLDDAWVGLNNRETERSIVLDFFGSFFSNGKNEQELTIPPESSSDPF